MMSLESLRMHWRNLEVFGPSVEKATPLGIRTRAWSGYAVLTVLISCAILGGVPLVAGKQPRAFTKPNLQVATPYGTFTVSLSIAPKSFGLLILSGTVANQTDRAWGHLEFKTTLLDKDGGVLPTGPIITATNRCDLAKGGVCPLLESPITFEGFPHRPLEKIADARVEFDARLSSYTFRYVFRLIKPTASDDLLFEDAAISIRFVIGEEARGVEFALQNKTDAPILVNWDKAAYVDPSGESHRVIHTGIGYADRSKAQSATSIAPTARINDGVFPADYINWSDATNEWTQTILLPQTAAHEPTGMKGQRLGVLLPVTVNGVERNYFFQIQIADVVI